MLLREMGLAEDLDSTEFAEKLHAQTFPDDAWSLDMLDLLRDSVHRRNQGGYALTFPHCLNRQPDYLWLQIKNGVRNE